jgi:hypothetical protein
MSKRWRSTALLLFAWLVFIGAAVDRPVLSRSLKFREDGKFTEDRPLAGHRFTKEEGIYNGVSYRFYHSDGSGTFGRFEETEKDRIVRESMERAGHKHKTTKELIGWKTTCKQDAMTGKRHCSTNKNDLWVSWFDNSQLIISIGSKPAPGSQIALRFGKEAPLTTSEKGWYGEPAIKLLQRLIAEKRVATRYRNWPANIDIDKETELFGLKEVCDFLKFAVAQKAN